MMDLLGLSLTYNNRSIALHRLTAAVTAVAAGSRLAAAVPFASGRPAELEQSHGSK